MFKLFKKDKSIYSPVNGRVVALENAPDQIFSSKMMGDGVAFELFDHTVYAPCDGRVTVIADTKHAYGITSDSGVEILIHIGLDTVNFGGKGFDVKVKAGDKVKRGQPLVHIDRDFFIKKEVNLITPLVLTNYHDIHYKILEVNRDVSKDDRIIEIQ